MSNSDLPLQGSMYTLTAEKCYLQEHYFKFKDFVHYVLHCISFDMPVVLCAWILICYLSISVEGRITRSAGGGAWENRRVGGLHVEGTGFGGWCCNIIDWGFHIIAMGLNTTRG